jgi:hypothetical protein
MRDYWLACGWHTAVRATNRAAPLSQRLILSTKTPGVIALHIRESTLAALFREFR